MGKALTTCHPYQAYPGLFMKNDISLLLFT
jgi:hypothetical protein